MIDQKTYKLLNELIDNFLEDKVFEFSLKLNAVIEKKQFDELIKNYDSSNGTIQNNINIDEYVYDIDEKNMKKIIIEYIKQQNDKITIFSIQGFGDMIKDE